MSARAVGLLALILLLGGCAKAKKGPPTYPVKGTVTYADGSAYPGGLIEFRSATQPFNAVGRIQSDGTFSLHTLTDRGKLEGAVEGSFAVTVTPDMEQQGPTVPKPIAVPGTVSVKADDSNDLTIKLPATIKK